MRISTGLSQIYGDNQKEYFAKPTIEYLRNFIADYNISDQDSILIETKIFDELALDFRETYKEPIKFPFIYLGVWIKAADRGTIHPQQAVIVKDDPRPEPEPESRQISDETVYRCGYCGKIVDKNGEALKGESHELAVERLNEHGHYITSHVVGKCCEHRARNS